MATYLVANTLRNAPRPTRGSLAGRLPWEEADDAEERGLQVEAEAASRDLRPAFWRRGDDLWRKTSGDRDNGDRGDGRCADWWDGPGRGNDVAPKRTADTPPGNGCLAPLHGPSRQPGRGRLTRRPSRTHDPWVAPRGVRRWPSFPAAACEAAAPGAGWNVSAGCHDAGLLRGRVADGGGRRSGDGCGSCVGSGRRIIRL